MYPPKPTKDPYTLVQNMWSSLRRASDLHWGEEATVDQDDTGFKITFRLTSKIPADLWKMASKYMRGYAKRSNWTVAELSQNRGHVAMRIEYAPPKPHGEGKAAPRRAPHPARQKSQE